MVADGPPDRGVGLQRSQPGRFRVRFRRATQQDKAGPRGRGNPNGDLGRDTPRASADDDHLAGAKQRILATIRLSGGKSHKLDLIGGGFRQTHLGGTTAQHLCDDPFGCGFERLVRGVEIDGLAMNFRPFLPRGLQ